MSEESNISVVIPIEINDLVLISTNVSEADYAAYNSATTYALGTRVISITTHKIYESAQAGNLNKSPTDINNRTGSTIWWIEIDSTNARKMFDGEKTSATIKAVSLTVVMRPGFVNALYAGGLVGDSAVITMTSPAGGAVVYSKTIALESSYPDDWYEYFFAPFRQQPDLIINDLPPYQSCEITFTLSISSGNVECSMFQIGDLRPLGLGQYDASATPKSYSYVKIDEFGNNEIVRRKKATDADFKVILDPISANTAMDILNTVLDVPVVCVATTLDDYAWLRVFGLVNGKVIASNCSQCIINVTVKGLI